MKKKIIFISSVLVAVFTISSTAHADFCITNKGTKSRYIDISCGLDAVKLKNDYKLIKPGNKICKNNKAFIFPLPCIARVTDKSLVVEHGGILNAPLSAADKTFGGDKNNLNVTKPLELVLPGLGQTDRFCKIGPVYNSKVIYDNVLDKLDAKRNVFALCHYR